MPEALSYEPVPRDDLPCDGNIVSVVEPLELDVEIDLSLRVLHRDERLFTWKDPWLLIAFIVGGLVVPSLLCAMVMTYELTGRVWPSFLFSVHLSVDLWELWSLIPSGDFTIAAPSIRRRAIPAIIDIFLFISLYPTILGLLINSLFTDVDGTVVIEYSHYDAAARLLRFMGVTIGVSRFFVEVCSCGVVCYFRYFRVENERGPCPLFNMFECDTIAWSDRSKSRLRRNLRWIVQALFVVSMGLLFWATISVFTHWGVWAAPTHANRMCDPMDTTECILPFPNMEFMVPDNTTDTGWRVNIHPDILPRLKGGVKMHPEFLNEFDGFSTMAPLLFYVDGLKESQEGGVQEVRLQGPQNIAKSVTAASVTTLIDVENMTLIPHSAEIDYLDPGRPLVMVLPSKPLRHNRHYALIVLGARDAQGELLPPTPGMESFLSNEGNDTPRSIRYRKKVYPALKAAAPWSSTETIQLFFDFITVSEKAQLGVVRAVRDATLMEIESEDWDWKQRINVIRRDEFDCSRPEDLIARTIHASMEVPWFLKDFGAGHRSSLINRDAVRDGKARIHGNSHFVVHIPCSLRAAALRLDESVSLRAVVDFGHGLFYNRAEADWSTLLRMANTNGYIIIAMDWRGMSSFDLLVVVKTLMSKPSLFQAVRDNLVQGYANKLALQHFARGGLLRMDWMSFEESNIPPHDGHQPVCIFYGISQGGILGAGYTALLEPAKIIDRAILGVPGTPFAYIMSRSKDFVGYDAILLLNFYNNRHVRIFLSFAQMLWDSCEGAGLLASPLHYKVQRILIQAGLGDTVVPTIAAESLARALGAAILPGNPRKNIFDIPTESAAEGDLLGPHVTLTEILYKKENASLPFSNDYSAVKDNHVHWCVREDATMVKQVEEFINSGRIIDVCENDGCVRDNADNC